MDAWSIRSDSLARIKYGRQYFIIYLYQVQGLLGYLWRLSGDSRHAIAHKTYDVVQAVLVVRPGLRPGLSGRCIGNARHIFIGQHGMNTGESPGRASIDIANDGMGMGTGQETTMQHIPQRNIINKGGLAGDQLDGINFALGLVHNFELYGSANINQCGRTSSAKWIFAS